MSLLLFLDVSSLNLSLHFGAGFFYVFSAPYQMVKGYR